MKSSSLPGADGPIVSGARCDSGVAEAARARFVPFPGGFLMDRVMAAVTGGSNLPDLSEDCNKKPLKAIFRHDGVVSDGRAG